MKKRNVILTISTIAGIIFFITGCGTSAEQVRDIVRTEIGKRTIPSYISSEKVIGPYCPAVKAGGFLFLSGQLGVDPETLLFAGESIELQTEQVFKNIAALLEKNGARMKDIIQTTVYLKDMNDFSVMNGLYASHFEKGRYPTRTTVEVSRLPKDAKIEITATAFLKEKEQNEKK